jgi:hypothetical protein
MSKHQQQLSPTSILHTLRQAFVLAVLAAFFLNTDVDTALLCIDSIFDTDNVVYTTCY